MSLYKRVEATVSSTLFHQVPLEALRVPTFQRQGQENFFSTSIVFRDRWGWLAATWPHLRLGQGPLLAPIDHSFRTDKYATSRKSHAVILLMSPGFERIPRKSIHDSYIQYLRLLDQKHHTGMSPPAWKLRFRVRSFVIPSPLQGDRYAQSRISWVV